MSNDIHIFIGPRKTGTSWLYKCVFGNLETKEIRYPSKFGRKYVFNKYVSGQQYLCWPYLLHEPESLNALVEDLTKNGLQPKFYRTVRDRDSLLQSMIKFQLKYGLDPDDAEIKVKRDLEVVESTYGELSLKFKITNFSVIEPTQLDLIVLSRILGKSAVEIKESLREKVYVTNETAKIRSSTITRLFFKLKPFLPSGLQNITRRHRLRQYFFNSSSD